MVNAVTVRKTSLLGFTSPGVVNLFRMLLHGHIGLNTICASAWAGHTRINPKSPDWRLCNGLSMWRLSFGWIAMAVGRHTLADHRSRASASFLQFGVSLADTLSLEPVKEQELKSSMHGFLPLMDQIMLSYDIMI